MKTKQFTLGFSSFAIMLVAALSLLSARATELIVNGGFESGLSSWTAFLGTGIQATLTTYPHTGSHYAYLTGNSASGGIYQNVTIPSDASSATLSFWWNVSSDETTTTSVYDDFYVILYGSSGINQLATVKILSNLNKGTAGAYQQVTYDLMAYRGQTIRLGMNGQNDSSNITSFRIDDVSVQVTTSQTKIIALSGNLGFGSVAVNSSAQSTLTIANNGNSTLTVSSISYPSGFSGSWSGTITAGGSHPVTVTFSPTSSTSYGGTVTVNSDATSGVNTIAASGTGTATSTRTISLSGNLAFGSVAVNSSAQSSLTIANTGNSTLTISSISYPSGFSGSWSGTIAAGGSHPVTVTFSPTSATSYGGTVTVNSDAASGVNTIAASGTGTVNITQPLGVDVHGAQGVIDWAAVHSSGKSFAFLKATEGTTFIDTDFTAATHNIDNALANNLLVGAYHFALPLDNPGTNGAIAEANHFLSIAAPYIGHGYLPPVLDIENHPYPSEFPGDICTVYNSSSVPVGIDLMCKLGGGTLSTWIRSWASQVQLQTGVQPIIYIDRYYLQNLDSDLQSSPLLWIADWDGSSTSTPAYNGSSWPGWKFKQYSDTGTVPGIGSCDLDSFNGDLSALQALANPTVTPTRVISLSGSLAFGSVPVNTSAQSTLTIYNSGNSTMTVSGISYPSGFSGSWSGTIAAGGSHPVTVTFSPTSATSYGGTVTVNSDATSGGNTITASGTGTVTPTRIISLGGSLAFGSVPVNTSAQNTLTIYNSGNSTMTVSGISYPSGFSGNWSGTIAAGGSHPVTVTFSPTSATSYGGTVTVNSDATSGGNTITASGTGTMPPTRIISLGGSLAFGSVPVNTSAQSTLTIYNSGNSTMTVSSISYPSGFSGNWSGTIAAGGSQPVAVTFSPTSAVPYGGTVTVNSPDMTSGVNTITASGTGTVTPTRIVSLGGSLVFGSVPVNTSAQSTLTIYNNGNSTMTVSSISYPSGFSGNWSGTIAAGGSQPVAVTFSPTSATTYGGTVTVNSDKTSGVNTIAASGTGTATPTRIIALSGNLAFGNVMVGSSAQATLTIANNGNSTMTVSSISYPSGFSGSWSGTIGAGGSQPVTVTFSPTSSTSYGGTVTVNSDMTIGVNTIAASGTGTTPTRIIALSGNLAFGSVLTGTSAQSTLAINNTGNSTMTISSISYPSGFSGSWSGTIAAGGSRPVTVTFSPTSATGYGGTVTVNSDKTSGVTTIAASGTGTTTLPDTTPPALAIISPANNAVVTSASLAVSGTASDSGYGNNGISSVTVNGVSASGGTASGSGTAHWSTTITLSPGANTVTVVAKDTPNNSRQQQITVTYNAPAQTNTVFSDNFNDNAIDTSKWTTSGNTVTEASQTMQVLTTVTDQGGVLASAPVPINPHGDITITRRASLHYASQYFAAQMNVKFGGLGWAGVRYANYIYASNPSYGWEDRYGIYLSRNDAYFISQTADTNLAGPFSPIWNTWFTEKLVYSPDTGNLQYFTNNQKVADFSIGVMPPTNTPTIQFSFTAWGWYTGHQQLFDDFMVTQTSAAATQVKLAGMNFSNRVCRFVVNGPVGSNYVVKVTTNLVNWVPLSTNRISAGGWVIITDTATTNMPQRFYRATAP